MPTMVNVLHTDPMHLKLVYAVLMTAYGIAMLFYGPLSDRYSRKKPLLIGLAIYFFGSVLACIAQHINILLLSRVVQGAGLGVAIIAWAMTKDVFHGPQFVRSNAVLSTSLSVGNILALVVGSYLLHSFGWRSAFATMAVFSFVLWWLLYWRLPETQPVAKKSNSLLKSYLPFLRSPTYLAWVMLVTLTISMELVYGSNSAFLLQVQLHVSSIEYAWLSLPLTAAGLIAASISSLLAHRVAVNKIVLLSLAIITCSGMLLMACAHFNTVLALLLPTGLMFIGTVICGIGVCSVSLSYMPTAIGSAAALQWCVVLTVSGLITALCAKLGIHSQTGIGGTVLLLVVLAWGLIWWFPCRVKE